MAYATDLQDPVVYRVVEDRAGGFRLGGRYLFTVQSNTGQLFRVDTRTREVAEVDLGGESLPNGDGLFVRGATVYAVQNALGVIAEVRLGGVGAPAPSGRVVARTGDASFAFPTTLGEARGRLLVVNSQFNRRGGQPVLPFTVSVVKLTGAPEDAPRTR